MTETTNKIFYGPPGTGKTWSIVEESLKLALDKKEYDALLLKGRSALQQRFDELASQGVIELVTFHPSYTYEDFVEGLRPITTDDGRVIYEVVPGVLRRIARKTNELEFLFGDFDGGINYKSVSLDLRSIWAAFLNALRSGRQEHSSSGFASDLIHEKRKGCGVDYDVVEDDIRVTTTFDDENKRPRLTRVKMSHVEKAWLHELHEEENAPTVLFKRNAMSSGHDTDVRLVYAKLKEFRLHVVAVGEKLKLDLPRAWAALIGYYKTSPATLQDGQTKIETLREGEHDLLLVTGQSALNKQLTQSRLMEWLKAQSLEPALPEAPSDDVFDRLFRSTTPQPALSKAARRIYDDLRRLAQSLPQPAPPPPRACVLVIDEINRGNISKIFGELMTIVEPSRRLGAPDATRVRLPLAGDDPDALFGLPANLHILGTMNTADRSIALMDVALRRRFEFVEIMPDPLLLEQTLPAEIGVLAFDLLSTLNERITFLLDRDHLLGHAALMRATSLHDLRDWLARQVIPLLQEYFYGDWTRIALVLGCPFDARGNLAPAAQLTPEVCVLRAEEGRSADALFYGQWRDPAPLRLVVNPALASASPDTFKPLLLGILSPDHRKRHT